MLVHFRATYSVVNSDKDAKDTDTEVKALQNSSTKAAEDPVSAKEGK